MANGINAPYGFKPVLYLNGSTYNGQTNEYKILATRPIYTGDLVTFVTGGVVSIVDFAAGPRIIAAPNTVGVFQGCKYRDGSGNYVFSPYFSPTTMAGATDLVGLVIDDPMVVYRAQSGRAVLPADSPQDIAGQVVGIKAADIGKNAGFSLGGGVYSNVPLDFNQNPASGNNMTGRSAMFVETTGIAVTGTIPLRLLGFAPTQGNVPYGAAATGLGDGAFNEVHVLINTHTYKSVGTAGI